jgi:hypothetical protein
LYEYLSMSGSASATVGIENQNGNDGLQIAFDTPYVQNNMAVLISAAPTQTWVRPSPVSGIVAPGTQQQVTLEFNTENLKACEYETQLELSNNSVNAPFYGLPVKLIVTQNIAPAIQPIANFSVVEMQAGQVSLIATDVDDPTVTLSLIDPPSFITLASSVNGNAIYDIKPSIGNAGAYVLNVQAVDMRGKVSTSTTALSIIPYGVENFSLVDKRNGQVIFNFVGNLTLNKADPDFSYYMIRANTNPPVVGSVIFNIDGKVKKGTTSAPYILAETELRTLKVGTHQLKAQAFTLKSGKGVAGKTAEATLQIINQQVKAASLEMVQITSEENESTLIHPNPVRDELRIQMTGLTNGEATLSILTSTGLPALNVKTSAEELKDYTLRVGHLSSGVYCVQVTAADGRRIVKRIVKL